MANEYTPVFDEKMARKMVVAANEGNELANTEFAQDIRTAPYAILEQKYGREVAENRRQYTEERAAVHQIENRDRDIGQIAGDAINAAATGFVGTVGSVASLGLAGVGAATEKLTGSDAVSDYAVDYAETAQKATQWMKSFQSQELQDRRGISGIEAQLDAEDNLAQYDRDTADREASFLDDLAWVGRGTLNNLGRIASDGAIAGDVVAEGIGSLGPSAKIASVASNLVTRTASYNAAKIANAIAPTQGTAILARGADVVNRGAIAASVGATEAAGVYSQTVNEILGMKHGELLETSEEYRKMTEAGVDPDDAKSTLAANAGLEAFKTSFPMAATLGVVAGKFEAMPMASFRGSGFIGGLRQVGAQTLEEGGQGFTGQFATNKAIVDTGVDPNRSLLEGTDEALATGMIAGTGMAGVMGTPNAIAKTPRAVADVVTSDTSKKLASAAATGTVAGAKIVGNAATSAAQSKVGKATVAGTKKAATTVAEKAAPVVEAANEKVVEYNTRPNREKQTETLSTLSQIAQMGETELTTKIDENQSDEALNSILGQKTAVQDTVRKAASGSVPSTFASTTPENASNLSRVGGILTKLTEKGVRISKLADGDVLYAAQEMNNLRNAIPNLPPEMQKAAKKVIASAEFVEMQKRADKIDLNKTQKDDTEITDSVVQETKAVALTNPVNANPVVLGRVLEQDDRTDLTAKDVKLMKVAKRVAEAIKSRSTAQIDLETERNVSLSVKPEYANGKKKLPEIKGISNVSENMATSNNTERMSVAGFTSTIMQGLQSKDGTAIVDGVKVNVAKQTVPRFKNLAQHMINKVGALNVSFDKQDANGKGTTEMFTGLNKDGKMVEAGMAGGPKSVYYHPSVPKSVQAAREFHADAVATVEAYNAMAEAFPEMFPDGPLEVPELRGYETQSEQSTEVTTPEEAAPTVVEEDVAPATLDETQAAEEATPEKTEKKTERTREDFDNLSEEDRVESANAWDENITYLPMEASDQQAVLDAIGPRMGDFELADEIFKGIYVLESPKQSELGRAQWGERIVGLSPETIARIKDGVWKDGVHVAFHEMMHIIDAYASKSDVTKTMSMNHAEFDPLFDGEIYKEVTDAVKAEPKLNRYFKYALSFNDPSDLASELFAEIGALYMLDPVKAKKYFPKGVAYVEQVIQAAGGKIPADGEVTPVRDDTGRVSDGQGVQGQPINQKDFSHLNAEFPAHYQMTDAELDYSNAQDLLEQVSQEEGTSVYVGFIDAYLQDLMDKANERLANTKTNKSDDLTIKERVLNGEDTFEYRRNKNTVFVDQTTGEYDADLLSIASMAVLDWLSGVRAGTNESLGDTLEAMGLTYDMVNEQQMRDIAYGVLPREVVENLTKDILRLWGMKLNIDSRFVDARGSMEGFVKELLESFIALDTGLITETKVPYFDKEQDKLVEQTMFNVFAMVEDQKQIGLEGQNALKKMVAPEENNVPSIGAPSPHVDKTQSRGDVKLSAHERKTLKRMQDQGHVVVEDFVSLVEAIAPDFLYAFLGKKDVSQLGDKHPLRASMAGKNVSIERDYDDAFTVINAARNSGFSLNGKTPPVYYRVGISKVGRHQFKGINPQNNKILRALVTPTKAVLDMTTKKHKDAFWLTVAQAADISGFNKVENQHHKYLLDNIQQVFNDKYGEAVEMVQEYLTVGGTLDGEALIKAMGGTGEMQQLSAVFAVAQLNKAIGDGTEANFETTLSFELDGKTDGPGNMMSNFGQGVLTAQDYVNFKRVGFFLGTKNMTLNKFFGEGQERDLYEVTSLKAQTTLNDMIAKAPDAEKERLHAVSRFATAFGELSIQDGEYKMSRNASKNPMTKTVYGSSERGIGVGLAQDMALEMYSQLLANNGRMDAYPGGHETFVKDYNLVFSSKFPENANWNITFEDKNGMDNFTKIVTSTLGKVLSDTAKEVIGDQITKVNDTLVLMTAFQTEFLTRKFEELLNQKLETRANEGKVRRNEKTGKPISSDMSQRDYNEVVAEIRKFSPVYANQIQTLDIGSFTSTDSGIKLSESMTGGFQMAASMISPELAGVKVIPYLTQGRGDAMMMNHIYGGDFNPEGTLPVFDGIDMPIDKIFDYAQEINAAVNKNWEADVLGDVVNDVSTFLERAASDGDLLRESWTAAYENALKKKSTAVGDATTPERLISMIFEMQRRNQARKAVFQKIGISVDHMGGSATAFVKGADGREWTMGQINDMITEEMGGQTAADQTYQENPDGSIDGEFTEIVTDAPQIEDKREPKEGEFSQMVVTDAETVMDSLLRETRNKSVAAAVRILKKANLKTRIIVGSPQEVSDWFTENVGEMTDGLNQEKKGIYVPGHDVILITDNNHETMVHELIHAATFQTLEAHYAGITTKDADTVSRLEALAAEFMDMDFSNASKEVQDAANSAKAQILVLQVKDDAFSKAAALNEFMAWSLSNEGLSKELGQRQTSVIARMTKVVKALMARMLGGVKSDMLSNILFNTELLVTGVTQELAAPVEDTQQELTPAAQKFTNFWIDLAKQRLEQAQETPGAQAKSMKLKQISDYRKNAQDAVDTLLMGGFSLNAYQQETFKAIHMVLAMEMRLNAQSAAALNDMFSHVTDNLKPEMFGPVNSQDRYSAVMEVFGGSKNDEGVSDAIAVLLALSQTSRGFRAALDQLPVPESVENSGGVSLNEFLSTMTGMLMNKAVGTIDLSGQSASETLDQLAQSILQEESEKEFRILRGLMENMNKADGFLNGAMRKLAGYTDQVNQEVRDSTRSNLTKMTMGAITAATAFLDQDRASLQAQGLKNITHMGTNLDWAVFAREFVTEVVGTDENNRKVVQLQDEITYAASTVRQNFREDLPVLLQDTFETHPTEEQWRATHKIMGRTDFALIYDDSRPNRSFEMIKDENIIDAKIVQAEGAIRSNFSPAVANIILSKGQQLADFMNGKGVGHQLWRNAFAINMFAGDYKPGMTAEIDQLVSLYALKGSDPQMRQEITRMYESDPIAMRNLMVYMQGLNKEEDLKTITEAARLHGYKGYIPDHGQPGTKVIISRDENEADLIKKGYTRVADAPAEDGFSVISRGYYVTSTKQTGTYSQGAMQLIQDTYRGVDATTGLSVNGATSGLVMGAAVEVVTDQLNDMTNGLADNKEGLIPVYDPEDQGAVLYYERAINPDIMEKYSAPKSNLALMLGVWAGRQVEEKIAQKYNQALIDELKRIHDDRADGEDDLFINLPVEAKKLKLWNDATPAERKKMKKPDPVYVESWNVISPQTKRYIESVWGNNFYVRKDQMNVALGYRDPSVIDMWTGNTRMPDAVREGVQAITGYFMGDDAMKAMAATEGAVQGAVSTAKDLIVVRSLVVPYMNTQANVVQLSTRGIPVKQQYAGYKAKLSEIETFNANRKKIMALDTRIQLAGTDKNKVRILESQKQVILDQNARMSIAPLIKAGAYKNISEGLTDMDVDITSGRVGDWIENQLDKLPTTMGVQTIAKYGVLSKDTAIYKGANKAVQYGDFIAKAIFYDHLIGQGMTHDDAMKLVNEEFVNFSVLPGRTRTYMEGIGATWFLTFKIRIMKIAMNQMRENPARSLVLAATIADLGSPQADNLASVIADDRIGYALGWDMLLGSAGLNPWINMTNG